MLVKSKEAPFEKFDSDVDFPIADQYLNLASESLGAEIIWCTDEFFAAAERMLQDTDPVFLADKFDDNGKWMDGWETRRRRNGGHDSAIVKLGVAGVVKGIGLDTRYFTGNYPPAALVEAAVCPAGEEPNAQTQWIALIPTVSLAGDSQAYESVENDQVWTHVRVSIFPDGGLARLRIYGQAVYDWGTANSDELYEVSSLLYGGRVVACNNSHFGTPKNLIKPGKGINMGDGWETRRRREPGNDWVIFELGHAAVIHKFEVDTAFFKGNYPAYISMQCANLTHVTDASVITQSMFWDTLLESQSLSADRQHVFTKEALNEEVVVTHVKINIFPDGGLSRIRLWGELSKS